MTLLPRHTRATVEAGDKSNAAGSTSDDGSQIVLEWHTGAMATVTRYVMDVPSEHYADLFEKALRAVGTSRVVWYRVDDIEETA